MTVQVSSHAVERYLERVEPSEPYPRQAIRDELEGGERVTVNHIHGETIRSPVANVWYVLHGDRVVTVLKEIRKTSGVESGGDDD